MKNHLTTVTNFAKARPFLAAAILVVAVDVVVSRTVPNATPEA